MQKSNFHTHTIFSDGHDTVREMIDTALEKGFHTIGFSDHSPLRHENDWTMTPKNAVDNYNVVRNAAEEYRGRIKVVCGLELDRETEECDYADIDYYYIISSVHHIVRGGKVLAIDLSADEQRKIVSELCGSSCIEFAKMYFHDLTEHVCRNKTDIVGHFDLLTKYSLIPEESDEYISCAVSAIGEIIKYSNTFELNTGAIARGLRTVPYPAGFILDEIKRLGGRVIITSDCHYRHKLDYWFNEAESFLQCHGFIKNENAFLNERVGGIEIWS